MNATPSRRSVAFELARRVREIFPDVKIVISDFENLIDVWSVDISNPDSGRSVFITLDDFDHVQFDNSRLHFEGPSGTFEERVNWLVTICMENID